jgi:hypothetical protein
MTKNQAYIMEQDLMLYKLDQTIDYLLYLEVKNNILHLFYFDI